MNIMIVVVLAVVWVVALTPMVLRRISERQLTSGVRSYHRRLLRLGSSSQSGMAQDRPVGSVPGAMIGYSVAAQRLHVERYGPPSPSGDEEQDAGAPTTVASALTPSRATTARRRQVVAVLAGSTLFFFVVGIIPAARVMWDFALLGLICAAAYVALLVHFNRLAVERAQKVIALETRRHASEVLQRRRSGVSVDQARGTVAAGYGGNGDYLRSDHYAYPAASSMRGSGWSVLQPARTAGAR